VDLKQADYDIAVAAVAKAEALLKQAKLQLSYTTITSPVTGRISRRYVDKGNLVGSGEKTLLTRVVRFDPIYVYSNISETLLSQMLKKAGKTSQERRKAKLKFNIGLATEEGFPHEGLIDFIDNRLDETTGTVQIRGVVPNENGLLYPGMFVRMRAPSLDETAALLVHEKAVGTDLGGKFILIVGQDNIVERRYVKLGQLYEDRRVIEKGLKATDRYIYKGIQRARPGMPVTPKEESETEKQEPDSK
jgi:RND family efflux transporter MFP subunit